MSKIVRDHDRGRAVWLLVFVVVCVTVIVFSAASGRFSLPVSNKLVSAVVQPFQRAAAWSGNGIRHLVNEADSLLHVHEENKRLRDEVAKLRVQNVRANEYAEENIRLRNLLDYKNKTNQFELLPAKVIGREAASWTSVMIIDRGSNEGVRKDMTVVTENGLVGCVTEAGPFSSKVELITDARVSVGALVQRSRVAGVAEGSLMDPLHPRIVHLTRESDIALGDLIITSGLGGRYPKGIIIGHVKEINSEDGGLLKYGVIEPLVDFDKLEDVAVITACREGMPEPFQTPVPVPGTESGQTGAGGRQ